jgi:predicted nucleic acid-binding protein
MPPNETAPVVLDACVCINLAAAMATDQFEAHLGLPVRIVEQAAQEALFLLDVVDGQTVKTKIELRPLLAVSLVTSEFETYVQLASELDDGEAASLAVAHHRQWSFATDDRAARNAVAARGLAITLLSTAQLFRICVEQRHLRGEVIRQMLDAVQRRASFAPPCDDPEFSWWLNASK